MNNKTPFKAETKFIDDINRFLEDFGQVLNNEVSRISMYFEITCYNYIIQFYQNQDFDIQMVNLNPGTGDFIYQLSPNGNPNNFSYFLAQKQFQENGKNISIACSIRQNIRVQSRSDNSIFFTPDIVISQFLNTNDHSEISSDQNLSFYRDRRNFYFIANRNLITFAEAKHLVPFPELIGNFIGIVHELQPDLLQKRKRRKNGIHLAPSILISGNGENHVSRIKASFEGRYAINVLFKLISDGSQLNDKQKIKKLNKLSLRSSPN